MVGYSYRAVGDNVSRNDFMDRADLLIERNRLYADNCDLEAEWNRLRATNAKLLAALREAIDVCAHQVLTPTEEDMVDQWRAAIARAEGKQ
jgi:hypothetical protein